MPSATRAFIDRTALVFDFDLTLAPGTIDAVLARFEIDPATWRHASSTRWSRTAGTRSRRRACCCGACRGRTARDYPRLPAGRRPRARVLPGSGGRARAPLRARPRVLRRRRGRALHSFLWLHRHHHRDAARAAVPRHLGLRLLLRRGGRHRWRQARDHQHREGALLDRAAKGIGVEGANEPAGVDRDVPAQEWHVPLDQMLYVGDGASDLPAFDLGQRQGGLAVGGSMQSIPRTGRPLSTCTPGRGSRTWRRPTSPRARRGGGS